MRGDTHVNICIHVYVYIRVSAQIEADNLLLAWWPLHSSTGDLGNLHVNIYIHVYVYMYMHIYIV